jgi:hypothetical protein
MIIEFGGDWWGVFETWSSPFTHGPGLGRDLENMDAPSLLVEGTHLMLPLTLFPFCVSVGKDQSIHLHAS